MGRLLHMWLLVSLVIILNASTVKSKNGAKYAEKAMKASVVLKVNPVISIKNPSKVVKFLPNKKKFTPCRERNFETMETCCRTLPGGLFDTTSMLSCNRNVMAPFLFRVTSDYILNKMQAAGFGGAINFAYRETASNVAPYACFTSCLFRAKKLYAGDSTVNYTAVTSYFEVVGTGNWKSIINESITSCRNAISDDRVRNVVDNVSGRSCDLQAVLLLQCVRRALITSCPASLQAPNKFCDKKMTELLGCNAFRDTFMTTFLPPVNSLRTLAAAVLAFSGATVAVDSTDSESIINEADIPTMDSIYTESTSESMLESGSESNVESTSETSTTDFPS